jgi:hypothetical protein
METAGVALPPGGFRPPKRERRLDESQALRRNRDEEYESVYLGLWLRFGPWTYQ